MPITKTFPNKQTKFHFFWSPRWCLNNTLTLGTIVYSCMIKITSTKWAPEEMSHIARSAISNFKTNPCLLKVDYEQ